MNQVELLQGQVAALSRRMECYEKLLRLVQVTGNDPTEAGRVAIEVGFDVEIFHIKRKKDRWWMAQELRNRGWSIDRIARVFGCSERAVRRWVATPPVNAAPPANAPRANDEKGKGRGAEPE